MLPTYFLISVTLDYTGFLSYFFGLSAKYMILDLHFSFAVLCPANHKIMKACAKVHFGDVSDETVDLF